MFESSAISVFIYLIYPLIIVSVGVYVSITKEMTLESYYFADRKTHWLVLGTSFITTSLFGPYLFGLAYTDSLPAVPIIFGIVSIVMITLLVKYFVPVYLSKGITTLPEFFEKRFNKACKYLLSSLYVLANVFLRLFVILVAGNVIISMVAGIDAYFTMIFFLLIASILLVIGGLQAEMLVNLIQMFIVAVVLFALVFWILNQREVLERASGEMVFLASAEKIQPNGSSWIELVFGLPLIGFWFWTADQFVIQKLLSAKDSTQVRKASIFSGVMQVIPVLVFMLPAVMSILYFQNINSVEIFNLLINREILPDLLKGGIVIAVAATIIAAIASLFNSTSMLLTFDFYKSIKPDVSGRELVLVGRLIIILLLFASILLMPLLQNLTFNSCLIMLEYFSCFAALVGTVFLIGFINSKISSTSALVTLIFGILLIVSKISIDSFGSGTGITTSSIIAGWFSHSGFAEFTLFLFLISSAIMFLFDFIIPIKNSENGRKSFRSIYTKMKLLRGIHKSVMIFFSAFTAIIVWWIN